MTNNGHSRSVKFALSHGASFPFDMPDELQELTGDEREAFLPLPGDWTYQAARGILANLCDRRQIKWGFQDIDEDCRKEIVESLAAIIKAAADPYVTKRRPKRGKENRDAQ